MPTRPDIRDLLVGVHEAFADADRDTLLDVLSFVVKEYVVDGPPPMMIHQVEQVAELANLSFPQLIATLQTRFEHPEWALFAVEGEQVSVRIGGVMQPLASRGAMAAAVEPPRPSEPSRAAPAAPAAAVRAVEAALLQNNPAASRPAPPSAAGSAPAPRPTAGLSVRPAGMGGGSGGGGAGPTNAAPASSASAVANPGASAAPAATPPAAPPPKDEPKHSGDDASARFSLLELD